jgi:putative transposase
MPSNLKRHQSTGQDHFITFTCYKRRPLLTTEQACTSFETGLEKTAQPTGGLSR